MQVRVIGGGSVLLALVLNVVACGGSDGNSDVVEVGADPSATVPATAIPGVPAEPGAASPGMTPTAPSGATPSAGAAAPSANPSGADPSDASGGGTTDGGQPGAVGADAGVASGDTAPVTEAQFEAFCRIGCDLSAACAGADGVDTTECQVSCLDDEDGAGLCDVVDPDQCLDDLAALSCDELESGVPPPNCECRNP